MYILLAGYPSGDPCTINNWVCGPDEISCQTIPIEDCCKSKADCQDGIFCNGEEFCFKNICRSGTPPLCFEDDPDRDGFCDRNVDQCAFIINTDDDVNEITWIEILERVRDVTLDTLAVILDIIILSFSELLRF